MAKIEFDYAEILSALLDDRYVQPKPEWIQNQKKIRNDFQNFFGLVISTPSNKGWTLHKKSQHNVKGIETFKDTETYQLFFLICAILNVSSDKYILESQVREDITRYAYSNIPQIIEDHHPFDLFLHKRLPAIIDALKSLNILEDYEADGSDVDPIYYIVDKPSNVLRPHTMPLTFSSSKDYDFRCAINHLFMNTHLKESENKDYYDTLQLRKDDLISAIDLLQLNDDYKYLLIEKSGIMTLIRHTKKYNKFPTSSKEDMLTLQLLTTMSVDTSYQKEDIIQLITENELYQSLPVRPLPETQFEKFVAQTMDYGFISKTDDTYQPTLLKNIIKEEIISNDTDTL